jgi:hypothetical protein
MSKVYTKLNWKAIPIRLVIGIIIVLIIIGLARFGYLLGVWLKNAF